MLTTATRVVHPAAAGDRTLRHTIDTPEGAGVTSVEDRKPPPTDSRHVALREQVVYANDAPARAIDKAGVPVLHYFEFSQEGRRGVGNEYRRF